MFRSASMACVVGAVGLSVAAATAACGGSPTSPAAPRPTYVISGVVAERTANGQVPVEGAVVSLVQGGRSAATDSSGSYSVSGAPAGPGTVTTTKDGYLVASANVNLSADTRVDFELVRRAPPSVATFTLSGTVYEQTPAGRVPIEGVRVEESYRHIVSTTGRDGRYSFVMDLMELGRFDGFIRLHVTRDGFQIQNRDAVMYADTQLDIEIVRR